MAEINKDLLRDKIIRSCELTGLEKRYLEGLLMSEPVKHGIWIDKTEWIGKFGVCHYQCSNCGYMLYHKPGSRGDGNGGKYCDECGAKMDGGENHD